MNNEFKYGSIAMIVGSFFAVSPFLLHLAFIIYVFGAVLILWSKKQPIVKTIWILSPLILVIGLYWQHVFK